jgi:hypothetical protein
MMHKHLLFLILLKLCLNMFKAQFL